MGHNITVQQLLDRRYRHGTHHDSKTTDGQIGTDMGQNITVRQLLDRVVQTWDTTSQ